MDPPGVSWRDATVANQDENVVITEAETRDSPPVERHAVDRYTG